jgi:tRNA pseudouridine(38-40) synthase
LEGNRFGVVYSDRHSNDDVDQADRPSVQGALRDAVIRFTGETVEVRGAGRTDAGVHATGQVAHLDLTRDWDPFVVREALNHHLKPAPVAVVECERASAGFDARFVRLWRFYLMYCEAGFAGGGITVSQVTLLKQN